MTNQSASRDPSAKPARAQQNPITVKAEPVMDRMKEVYESIAQRAYDFFESRSYQHGHDFEDWLRAESELLCPVPVTIKESDDQLTVLAQVTDFSAQEIEISAEPQRVFISGNKHHATEWTENEADYTRQEFVELFRAIDLPAEVDPLQVTATLEDGVLNITLPKTGIRKAADTE